MLGAAGASVLAVPLVLVGPQAAVAQGRRGDWHKHSHDPVLVVSGLNNPRELALTDHGRRLLIAEAGKGGTITTVPSPEGGTTYIGDSGSISSVLFPRFAHDRTPHPIVPGLLS